MDELAEQLFFELKNQGQNLDSHIYTEMIGVYIRADMPDKALDMYESMKMSGCIPNELTFTILIKNLEITERKESVVAVKRECAKYMDFPKQFIEEIERTYAYQNPDWISKNKPPGSFMSLSFLPAPATRNLIVT